MVQHVVFEDRKLYMRYTQHTIHVSSIITTAHLTVSALRKGKGGDLYPS